MPADSSTRRGFLSATAAFAITSAKGAAKAPVMGSGEHTYEVTHDWPQLPDDLKFGNTHGVVADSQGRLIIAHTVHSTSKSGDAIAIFDADGKFVKSWGADMRGGAHGLTIRREGSDEFLLPLRQREGLRPQDNARWRDGVGAALPVHERRL